MYFCIWVLLEDFKVFFFNLLCICGVNERFDLCFVLFSFIFM